MLPKSKAMPVQYQVMSVSQRAMVAAEEYLRKQDSDSQITMEVAARKYGIGVASVRAAKIVLTSPRAATLSDDLGSYVKEGYISVRGAAALCGYIATKRKSAGRHFMEYLVDIAEGKCPHCDQPITPDSIHKDHIIALDQGGSDKWHNMQALCQPCNSAKKNRLHAKDIEKLFGSEHLKHLQSKGRYLSGSFSEN